ncbi:MAG: RecX family transcriptional regulator [Blastocatellia bacterium]|nr:RecX family transcriptional regulator [Blastocatellia bacterium]MCS7157729.1 RecX family transcriptional regulator [Blastocatellia bacterium]MCX7751994.1 RecX family transcriptional regulator [Blastocatellia bacterium]MDW8167100.1 RecX family transcriptional regulator [Acidobacteriota bacterium]MDW8257204.1 RecX family transcriptional regulator [Acidobacteriota bacterium]
MTKPGAGEDNPHVMTASRYQQLMNRAFRLLSRKALSTAELRAKLLEKAPEEEQLVEQVLARLRELGYLNDGQLASDYALMRLQLRPMGRRRLREELRRKRLPEEAIESALEQAYRHTDEESLIARAVQKWMRTKGRPRTTAEAKRLFDHLMRLGFEHEHIHRVLREISKAPLEEE